MPTLYRDFTEQAQIDAQYNAAASVSDFPRHVQRWRDDSRAARAALQGRLKVPYGPTLAETLDIFPAAAPGAPVLVFIHGGYWRSFAAEDFSFVATGAHAAGFTTVVLDYALCPWVDIGEIVRQVRAGIAWVHRHIGQWGGDPDRIAVSGHSAGGHLTAMALFTDWPGQYGLPQDLVKAALPISGLYDLRPLRYSYLQPALQIDDATVARHSPMERVRRVDAAVLAAWGGDESAEFARQTQDFAAALQAAGARVETLACSGAHHFTVLDGFLSADSPFLRWLSQAV